MSRQDLGSGPLVIKIGGSTLDERRDEGRLWRALAELKPRLAGGLMLVHGGGKAVDRQMERLGVKPVKRDGLRLTPEGEIDDVVGVLAGGVNLRLVAELRAAGLDAVGLTLASGGLGRCVKRTDLAFDPGRVGTVKGGDARLAKALFAGDFVPVVSSIGADAAGPLNVNADDAAAGLAVVVRAGALVLLTDVEHIRDAEGTRLAKLTVNETEQLIARGDIHGGMIPKVRAAAEVARHGVRVVVLSGASPEHLTAWLRGEDIGTTIAG